MGLESALNRINELQQLLEPAAAALPAAPGNASAFAGALTAAQGQLTGEDARQLSQLPGAEAALTPALPQLGAPASLGSLTASVQGVPLPASASGLPLFSAGVAGVGGPYGVSAAGAIAPAPAGGIGQQIVALAQREVGVAESPPGSNNSARIRDYRSATAGAIDTPGPWCAYFTSWLCKQVGAPIGNGGSGLGWVPSVESWGRETGRLVPAGSPPQPGDLAIFERNGDGVADHIGIVEYVEPGGKIHTIEGNSSDRVARRSYDPASIRSFVRPG